MVPRLVLGKPMTIENHLVSILINNYNYGHFLGAAIDSALAQTYPNVEVIVVDDGSTDHSREVMAAYGDRIIPILKKNGGQASAFNAGFAASRGDIICFLDSDDQFLPEKAAEVVKLFDQFPESGWLFHTYKCVGLITKDTIYNASIVAEGEKDGRSSVRRGHVPFLIPGILGSCFRRALLAQILPMPEAYDIAISDMYIKDLAVGLSKGYYCNRNLAIQTIHQQNRYTMNKNNLETKAAITVHTAYWLRTNFPEFTELANRMYARALLYKSRLGVVKSDCSALIDEYWCATSPLAKVKVRSLKLFYRLKTYLGGSI